MVSYTWILILFAVAAIASDSPDNGALKDGYFKPDENCNKVGGRCIMTELCRQDKVSSKGNCKWTGSTCCHDVPMNETRCKEFGGACMQCTDHIVNQRATDCQQPLKCCILV